VEAPFLHKCSIGTIRRGERIRRTVFFGIGDYAGRGCAGRGCPIGPRRCEWGTQRGRGRRDAVAGRGRIEAVVGGSSSNRRVSTAGLEVKRRGAKGYRMTTDNGPHHHADRVVVRISAAHLNW
jgi:hypothetical protein